MASKHSRITFGIALAIVTAALGISATASARIPVEPGAGSPVKQRQPAAQHTKKSTKRTFAGFPNGPGVHVKSLAELRTE